MPVGSEHWRRIKKITQDAVELPQDERKASVARACGADQEMRAEVESLLAQEDGMPADFMEPPGAGDSA